MTKKIHKITLNGQEINLKHLEGIMPKTQALIVGRLLYYLKFDNYIIEEDGKQYIRKSLKEWSNDIELWLDNGKKRRLSKTAVCNAFSKLKKTEIVISITDFSKVSLYGIDEKVLYDKIKKRFFDKFDRKTTTDRKVTNQSTDFLGLDGCREITNLGKTQNFDKLNEKYNKSESTVYKCDRKVTCQSVDFPRLNGYCEITNLNQNQSFGKPSEECNKSESAVVKSEFPTNKSDRKVTDQPLDSQGLNGCFGPGTYTYTYTYTNNKSYKSKDSDLRKVFFKNKKNKLGLRQQSDPTIGTEDISNWEISNKKDGDCIEQKSTIVQDMFCVWQEEFPLLEEKLSLEKSRRLKSAYDSVFDEDLEVFRTYLRRVKTSKFIVEKPHLLNMKWLLEFDKIDDIQSGLYGALNPDNPGYEYRDLQRDCIEKIKAKRELWACEVVRKHLLEKLGVYLYEAWFGRLFMRLDGDGKLVYTDMYGKHDQKIVEYLNAICRELQPKINAKPPEKLPKYFDNNVQYTAEETVHIDQIWKPKTINPKPPEELHESQISMDIAEKMLKIWNDSLPPKLSEKMNKEKSKLLNEAFVHSFNSDYGEVENFMKKLKNSVICRNRYCLVCIELIFDSDLIRKILGGFYDFVEVA